MWTPAQQQNGRLSIPDSRLKRYFIRHDLENHSKYSILIGNREHSRDKTLNHQKKCNQLNSMY